MKKIKKDNLEKYLKFIFNSYEYNFEEINISKLKNMLLKEFNIKDENIVKYIWSKM